MAAIDRMLCQVAEHFSHIGTEEIFMSVSYKKLWKLLIDKDMKKKDLYEKAGISPASVTKMGRNGHVTSWQTKCAKAHGPRHSHKQH